MIRSRVTACGIYSYPIDVQQSPDPRYWVARGGTGPKRVRNGDNPRFSDPPGSAGSAGAWTPQRGCGPSSVGSEMGVRNGDNPRFSGAEKGRKRCRAEKVPAMNGVDLGDK